MITAVSWHPQYFLILSLHAKHWRRENCLGPDTPICPRLVIWIWPRHSPLRLLQLSETPDIAQPAICPIEFRGMCAEYHSTWTGSRPCWIRGTPRTWLAMVVPQDRRSSRTPEYGSGDGLQCICRLSVWTENAQENADASDPEDLPQVPPRIDLEKDIICG